MGMARKENTVLFAVFGLWQLFVLHEALAGQPADKVGAAPNHESAPLNHESARLNNEANTGRSAGLQLPSGDLDLRPPSQLLAGEDAAGRDAPGPISDFAHRKLFAAQNVSRFEASAATADGGPSRAPAPAANVASGHIMSPMETLAHNFQQQGLPLARLFENKDSLVHLGLNQKGKPGLWILHKLH